MIISDALLRCPLFAGIAEENLTGMLHCLGARHMTYAKGETILVPAEMPDFYLVPRDRSTVLLEAVTRPVEEQDEYIDLSTDAFLEGEDYEGLEDGAFDEDDEPQGPAGASPLNFFN